MSKDKKNSTKDKGKKVSKAAGDAGRTLEDFGKSMLKLKAAAADAQEAFEKARAAYLNALIEAGQDKAFLKFKGVKHSITVTRRQNLVIDSEGLKKELGVRKFNTVAEYKVNRAKLEDAIEMGTIDAEKVQKYLSMNEGSPFITHKVIKEEENEDR